MRTRYSLMFLSCFIRTEWGAPLGSILLYGLTFLAHASQKYPAP